MTAALFMALMTVVAVAPVGAAEEMDIGGLTVLQLRKHFYVIAGDGQNIGLQVGQEGAVLVNAGTQAGSAALLAAVKKITRQPIRMVIDTSGDPQAVGGNSAAAASGLGLYPAGVAAGALIYAQENVLIRMSKEGGDQPAYPSGGWPTYAYLDSYYDLYFNGEPIEMLQAPAASSDGDSLVLFRRSDVVMSGAVMDMSGFPVIDLAHGGSIDGEVAALNQLLRLTVGPAPLIYTAGDGTYVVPAHGRVGDQWEVIDYRDMVVTIRDTVAYMMKRHMSLEQIEAAHPAKGYEPRYGSDTGPWTTHMFIEAIYRSLLASKKTG